MNINDIFQELVAMRRWVPYRNVWNPKREKFDKIPYSGTSGISTLIPDKWVSLIEAKETVDKFVLSGVGIVLTGGVDVGDWRLLGFDFDNINKELFEFPYETYTEVSPSGNGIRAFVWVPIEWALQFKDTTDVAYPNCDHAEVYLGSSPRFLTVTFNAIRPIPVARLNPDELAALSLLLRPAERTEVPKLVESEIGTPVHFEGFSLTPEQKMLVAGREGIDRSQVLHGLLIKLIDEGTPMEDVLATLTQVPTLWQYCLDHRHDNIARAFRFAREEMNRAYERSQTAVRNRLIGFSKLWAADTATATCHSTEQPSIAFPLDIYENTPGLVKEVADWLIKASFAPREEFAYAAALVMVSCMIGPYCTQGPRHGKLNLYMTLVGGTGTGKNEAIDMMVELMNATDAKDCVNDFPASEAALRRQLNVASNILLRVDELAHKLDTLQAGSNGTGLSRAILEAYNGARMPPKAYADERKCLPAVDNPYVQILGGTTDRIWDVMKTTHMEDGTLNRFVFVCLPDDPPYRRNMEPVSEVPKDLKDRLNAFWRDGRRYDLLGYVPPGTGRRVDLEEGVMEKIVALDHEAWEFQQKDYGSLYTRYTQNTIKVAAIITVGDGRQKISLADFTLARRFIAWCIGVTHHKIATRMADSNFERNTKRLLTRLAAVGGKLTMREAYRFMHISRRDMEEVTNTLMLSEQIEIVSTVGRETIVLLDTEVD